MEYNHYLSVLSINTILKVIPREGIRAGAGENNADFNTTNYMGGVYENIYDYDNLNRLIRAKGGFTGFISRGTGHNLQAYNLKMDYNDTHGIIQKNQSHTTHGYLPVYENTYSNKYEYMENTHKTIAITNEENGMVDEFKYDNNGNMKVNWNSNNYREMFWDESNRLLVVYDQNSYQMQHYIYDAAGERTLKASSKIENVYENGQVDVNNTTMGLYTTYVSPYMVVDANQKYSKHYFNGTQRVASKIGEQDITIFENGNQYLKQTNSKAAENTPSTDFDTLKTKQITDFSYYLSKSTNKATAKNVKVKYTEYKQVDTNAGTTSAKAADNNSTYAAPQYAEIYYYHSDHLGTGTFLSDFDGNPYQFFLNLPFGETMAEQHSYSGEYTNRYKFNGKELDEETGFYYYGARYYNPKFSIWLSVDPLAEKYPSHTPYEYCFSNPINFIDPDGRSGEPVIDKKNKTITIYQHNIYYGGAANPNLSNSISANQVDQFNRQKLNYSIDGVKYDVKLRISYETVSESQAIEMAENNTDVKNNFWRIEDYGTKSSRFDPGGNSGWMNTYDDLRDSTTPLHENAHGLGLDHTAGDIKSTVPPGIMVARASTVSNKFSIDGKSVNGVDPYTRKFSQNEINSILSKVKFDASGRGEIGKTSNSIYNRQGNHRTFGDKVKTFFNNLF